MDAKPVNQYLAILIFNAELKGINDMAMKQFFKLGSFLLLFCVLIMSACKDDEPSKLEKYTTLLTQNGGHWTPTSVMLEGIEVKDDLFQELTVTFTKESLLTASGGSPMWPTPDTWTFLDENAEVIVRGSDFPPLTLKSISATELVIEMEWDQTTVEPGRLASLPGIYEFTFGK